MKNEKITLKELELRTMDLWHMLAWHMEKTGHAEEFVKQVEKFKKENHGHTQ